MASGWTLPSAAGPGFSGNPVAASEALKLQPIRI